MKKTPLATAVQEAIAPPVVSPQIDPQLAEDFNLIGQYVADNIAKEAPATRVVMNTVLTQAMERIKKALGG